MSRLSVITVADVSEAGAPGKGRDSERGGDGRGGDGKNNRGRAHLEGLSG